MDHCSLISGLPFYLVGLISGLIAGALVAYIQAHHDRDKGFSRIRGLNTPTKKERRKLRNHTVDVFDYVDEEEGTFD